MILPDLIFQYSWDCVRDLRTRVVNASVLTNLEAHPHWHERSFSRYRQVS